ncbi:hypothetical protein BE08_44360 [Sorangium cellulosum]|uniref:Uncharacterized protein n=1 Tax=Sorangium cellulosum TaxID=56 RepID=A0A150P6C2_SORCE|nr:hypothetical protein BE08_44360 [Sorangium cellulosum]
MIDLLFVLNAQRAEEEQQKGLAPATAKQKGAGKGAASKKTGRSRATASAQMSLPDDDRSEDA